MTITKYEKITKEIINPLSLYVAYMLHLIKMVSGDIYPFSEVAYWYRPFEVGWSRTVNVIYKKYIKLTGNN